MGWGAIRIDLFNTQGISLRTFRCKAKEAFAELGFPEAQYSTVCPSTGSDLYKKEARKKSVIKFNKFRKAMTEASKLVKVIR